MLVGSRLKSARIAIKLTQTELGKLIGVGKSAICCYEKETRNPTLESVIELIYVLGVSSDYLLGTDKIIEVTNSNEPKYRTLTNEEMMFIDELRKDKIVYEILFQDPKRGTDLIKKKIG
ncbi:MAG: helix-turn-helix transcriptional regulator [Clostridia bacterium]